MTRPTEKTRFPVLTHYSGKKGRDKDVSGVCDVCGCPLYEGVSYQGRFEFGMKQCVVGCGKWFDWFWAGV